MKTQHQHLTNLLTGTLFAVFNFGVGLVIGFVLAPFVLETLGKRYYGINVLAGSFVGAFALINLGIDGAVARYFTVAYAKGDKDECLKLGNTAFWLYTVLGLIGFIGILMTAVGVYYFNPEMEDRFLLVVILAINALAFCLNYPLMALTGIVNGTLRQELTGVQGFAFRVIGAAATFFILYIGRMHVSPVGLLIGLACFNVVLTFVNSFVLYRLVYVAFPDFVFKRSLFRKSRLKKLFTYGFFTFLIFLANTLQVQGNIFVVSAMIDIESIALYSMIAVSLSGHFTNVTELIMGNWLASWITFLLAGDDRTAVEKTLKLAYKMSVCFATFIAFGLIVWGPDFLIRWGQGKSADYLSAYPALVFLTLGVWNNQCQAPNTKYLFATAKHAFVGYASLIGNAIGLVFAAVMIAFGYGISGAAFSVMLSAILVRGTAIPIYLCLLRGDSIAGYYIKILTYVIFALISCIVPGIITYFLLGPTLPRLFLVGCLSALTYFPVYFLIALNREEKSKIDEIVIRKIRDKLKKRK